MLYNEGNRKYLIFTVVVIGFERSFYVVYEGQDIEICVAVLDRELSNDIDRGFTVATSQLTTEYAATGKKNYILNTCIFASK